MYDDVLVATDGSSGAEAASDRALDLARTGGSTLHALYVIDTGFGPPGLDDEDRATLGDAAEQRGRRATALVEERAEEFGVETVRTVREGVPHRVITEYAREAGVDLVVVGTHGRSGVERGRPGSTAERVVTVADAPVLTVGPGADLRSLPPDRGAYDDVVVATDGSDAAERAAGHGFGIAERYGADVHVVYVIDATVYEFEDSERSVVGLLRRGGENAVGAVAASARDRGLPVESYVLRGVPELTLSEFADGVDAGLLTLGTRGLAGVGERFLGSTTRRVLGRADCPVLTAR